MEEHLVNFLVRMAFLAGDSKEPDMQALHNHMLKVSRNPLPLISYPITCSR